MHRGLPGTGPNKLRGRSYWFSGVAEGAVMVTGNIGYSLVMESIDTCMTRKGIYPSSLENKLSEK